MKTDQCTDHLSTKAKARQQAKLMLAWGPDGSGYFEADADSKILQNKIPIKRPSHFKNK